VAHTEITPRLQLPETRAKYEELAGLGERLEELAGIVADRANRVARGEGEPDDAPDLDDLIHNIKGDVCELVSIHNSIGEAPQS
jgi:hypothetical protein